LTAGSGFVSVILNEICPEKRNRDIRFACYEGRMVNNNKNGDALTNQYLTACFDELFVWEKMKKLFLL